MVSEDVIDFIERVEKRVDRWQVEGLSPSKALNQAWANTILELEAEGVLPKGYLRSRVDEAGPAADGGDGR